MIYTDSIFKAFHLFIKSVIKSFIGDTLELAKISVAFMQSLFAVEYYILPDHYKCLTIQELLKQIKINEMAGCKEPQHIF